MKTSGLTILVTGFIVRFPVGGLAWHYGQYVAGLRRLGHRVFFIEDSEDVPSCFVPDDRDRRDTREDQAAASNTRTYRGLGTDPSYGLRFASDYFEGIGFPDAWCYYDAHSGTWLGPSADQARSLLESADLILNVSGAIALRPWHMQIPVRVLIDTDPVFSQVRHRSVPGWLDRSLRHNRFFTFGENYGKPGCKIPDDGLPWATTRQPLVLDYWREADPSPGERYTTVMSWDSYDPGISEGERFGVKADSFAEFVDLPRHTEVPLELAIDGPTSATSMLRSAGWQVVEALDVTRTPWSYRDYLRSSRGEFSIARQAYSVTNSGWFSERSAAYLATGRPVVTQDTGFGNIIPTGRGLLSFGSLDEAIFALDEVERDISGHARAAMEIAEAHFSSDLVLNKMLEAIYAADSPEFSESSLPGYQSLEAFRETVNAIDSVVPGGEAVILLDDNKLGAFGTIGGRRCAPFLERNGEYWGNPENSEVALSELSRMRGDGYRYLVIASTAYWWFDFYPEFIRVLEQRSERLLVRDDVRVFRLL